jgi:hypothetical protein
VGQTVLVSRVLEKWTRRLMVLLTLPAAALSSTKTDSLSLRYHFEFSRVLASPV